MRLISKVLIFNALLTFALAVETSKDDGKFLKMDMTKRSKGAIEKRSADGTVEGYIQNGHFEYLAILEIGSNKDPVALTLDTGSSDLWVMYSDVTCTPRSSNKKRSTNWFSSLANTFGFKRDDTDNTDNICTLYGSFNADNSTTFQTNTTAPEYDNTYQDGSGCTGVYGTDNVVFGGVTVENVNLAVVTAASGVYTGILGVGLPKDESSDPIYGFTYPNFPDALKSQGIINKIAYSIYYGDTIDTAGSIVFGGVDTAKYSGDLMTIPILKNTNNEYVEFWIALEGIELSNGEDTALIDGNSYAFVLDSGTTTSYFPQDLVETIVASLGGEYNSEDELYQVPCTHDQSLILTFNLGGYKLNLPVADLLSYSETNSKICELQVEVTGQDDDSLFGAMVLRHAYWVYDLESLEISVADVVITNEENIEAIVSSIPGASQAPGYSSTFIPDYDPAQASPTLFSYSTGKLEGADKLILEGANTKIPYFAKGYSYGPNTVTEDSSTYVGLANARETSQSIFISVFTLFSILILA
ncbi:aspartic peptidase domain-containing protein [Scheffersomyces coipomensis]|uniref:aspartic peptidase domain-containing protein n=1 Tax=Scheffersomyces coipomensis TaxID=1788519 RepID=UPI00315D5A5A